MALACRIAASACSARCNATVARLCAAWADPVAHCASCGDHRPFLNLFRSATPPMCKVSLRLRLCDSLDPEVRVARRLFGYRQRYSSPGDQDGKSPQTAIHHHTKIEWVPPAARSAAEQLPRSRLTKYGCVSHFYERRNCLASQGSPG